MPQIPMPKPPRENEIHTNAVGHIIDRIGTRHMNTFLKEVIEQAQRIEEIEKLKHQLFIGKVMDELGYEKTLKLLKESKEPFNTDKYDTYIRGTEYGI